jgi:hypothetical protein
MVAITLQPQAGLALNFRECPMSEARFSESRTLVRSVNTARSRSYGGGSDGTWCYTTGAIGWDARQQHPYRACEPSYRLTRGATGPLARTGARLLYPAHVAGIGTFL